jgi:transposase
MPWLRPLGEAIQAGWAHDVLALPVKAAADSRPSLLCSHTLSGNFGCRSASTAVPFSCKQPLSPAADEQYALSLKPHPVGVPAWACFSGAGPGYMAMYEGSLSAAGMADIYRRYLLPSIAERLPAGGPTRYLLHDNDSRHSAPAVKRVLHGASIVVLDFPPYSPDLNPIENLWHDVQRRMEGRPAATKPEVEQLLAETWAATSSQLCSKLALSMPHRIAQVIERKGAYTDY